jgi:hypothetical protein
VAVNRLEKGRTDRLCLGTSACNSVSHRQTNPTLFAT